MVLARARDGEAGRDSEFGSRRVKERETCKGRGLGACLGEDELDMAICRDGTRRQVSAGKSIYWLVGRGKETEQEQGASGHAEREMA